MSRQNKPKKLEKFIKVRENWYQNYASDEVRVCFCLLIDGMWRVCLWGADDFGMEKDFDKRYDALKEFKNVNDYVTKKELKERGFVNA